MPGCLRTAGVPVLLLACQSTPGLPGLSLRVCGTGIAAHTPPPLPVQLQSCNGDAAGARDSPRAIHSTSSEFTGVSQNQHPSAPTPGRLIPQGPQAFPPQGPKFLLVMRNQLGLDAGGSLSGGWGSCLAQTSFPQSSTASNTHLDAMSGLQLTLGELGFIAAIQV